MHISTESLLVILLGLALLRAGWPAKSCKVTGFGLLGDI